ncbi:MAG: ROK family protein [Chitinophagales bacterium]
MPRTEGHEGFAIGVDIGGTKIAVGLADSQGRLKEELVLPTGAANGRDHVLNQVRRGIDELRSRFAARHPGGVIVGIGVGTAGQVDFRSGKIVSTTGNLPGWFGTPIKDLLEAEYGLPVVVENDVNAAAWGEKWLGAGRGVDHFVCLTIGTGVGGAVVDGGRMLRGTRGGAGEVGHLILFPEGLPCTCGRKGCLEAYVSGPAIVRRYLSAAADLGQSPPPGEGEQVVRSQEVFQLAREGDPVARAVIGDTYRYLGYGIATLVNIFNPSRVIIGGGLSGVGDELLLAIRQAVREYALQGIAQEVEIVLAELGEKAGLYGAAYLVWEQVGRREEGLQLVSGGER